jgi:uncharacterized membrane protein
VREIEQIKRELDVVKFETDQIKNDVERIKDKLIDHTPEHFSKQDFVRAGIGALFLGFSALFSGNLLLIATNIPAFHLLVIILGTLLILTLEIYIIGYSRVTDKITRKFGQFWLKRISTFYSIAIIVAAILTYTFGFQYLVPSTESFIAVIVVLSAPCAIGASMGDLLKKY